ncbi:MAG: FHA domain-containing protein [Eubacterium sp.]|nr:FHA domain-containing protein [Eubacterium sp.]
MSSYLTIIESNGQRRKVNLDDIGKSRISFGRSHNNDIVINSDIVSGQHGYISKSGGSWIISDSNSTNGTRYNGNRIQSDKRINDGDEYEISYKGERVSLRFAIDGAGGSGGSGGGGWPTPPSQPQVKFPFEGMYKTGENELAILENDALLNFLSGEGIAKEKATLTNKRLYYHHSHGLISKRDVREHVDVKDITGTKIADNKPWFAVACGVILLIIGLILIISGGNNGGGDNWIEDIANSIVGYIYRSLGIDFVVASIIALIVTFFKFKKYLIIQYAGGQIKFTLRKVDFANVIAFQEAIDSAKENYTGVYK